MTALPIDSIKIGSRFRTEHCLMCVRGKPIVELLKRLGENVSEPQVEFWRWCVCGGVLHSVCRTLNEVLASSIFGAASTSEFRPAPGKAGRYEHRK